ncbi:MAG TPA: dihydroneopterin aldolase [Ferruginibacter sp.]|nr:dihydroneopterin aldolase [Ferruginibacter sp.]
MVTIQLKNLLFFSHHGIHEEEKILGNEFEVNAELSFEADDHIDSLEQTINYASVYDIIRQRMTIPTGLLETVTQDIARQVHAFDSRILSITVSIEKKNPPIPGMEGSVGVTFRKDF